MKYQWTKADFHMKNVLRENLWNQMMNCLGFAIL